MGKAGFGGKNWILACGGERDSLYLKLKEIEILKDGLVFNTIACSRVLCNVPYLEDTVAGLYDLLKPGGRLIICEHVKNL